jgi:hypothetical protein
VSWRATATGVACAIAAATVGMIFAASASSYVHEGFHKRFLIACGPVTAGPLAARLCPGAPLTRPLAKITSGGSSVTVKDVPSGRCGAVQLLVYVDGKEAAETGRIRPGQSSKVSFVVENQVTHALSFAERAFAGGCNSREPFSVAGTISVSWAH